MHDGDTFGFQQGDDEIIVAFDNLSFGLAAAGSGSFGSMGGGGGGSRPSQNDLDDDIPF